jgi:hypothetical protein
MKNNERMRAGDRGPRDVDDWLRRGLEPDRNTVERVVRQSMAAGRAARPRRWVAVGVASAATIFLPAAIAIFLPWGEPRESATETARGEDPVQILTITNVSGEVEVLYFPEGPGGGSVTPARPARDPNEVTIFNSNGIVAAFAPAPAPHHFLMGGEL